MAGERVVPVDRAGREGGHVFEMQRRRLLTATTEVVYERGVHGLTAALVAERAGMSRRTFHDIFNGREGCLLGAFEEAVGQAIQAVRQAVGGEERWAEKIRMGLTGLLSFLDYEPSMARLLIVEALACGEETLRARKRVLDRIIKIVDQGRAEGKTPKRDEAPPKHGPTLAGGALKDRSRRAGRELPPLTAEGTVGAVFSVVHARMLEQDTRSLTDLTGPLMAMIVAPYLGPVAAQKELKRSVNVPEPLAPRLPADPFKDLPIRLTYRTARVLASISDAPGASSKQVARAAGITDEGQTSKLLNRLQRYGLIHDTGIGPTKGLPRAWTLTQRGENILQAVSKR
jgi:AcrR family transcriptional regulator